MKKILSILLAMAMLISSITVAFVAFAARGDKPGGGSGDTGSSLPALTAEELVEKINAQTKFIADTANDDGTTHHLPGYALERTVTPNVTFDGVSNTYVDAIVAANYPEYADAPYCSDGAYNYGEILKNLVDVQPATGNVKKNSDASLSIGRDAIKAWNLDASQVASVTTETSSYVLNYNSIDIVAGEKVEDTVLPDVLANYPRATKLDDIILNSLANNGTGVTLEGDDSNILTLKDIKIKVQFDDSGRIVELAISYTLDGSMALSYTESFKAIYTLSSTTTYKGFDYYDESGEFDLAELVAKVNAGTANIVDMKAGYDYARMDTIAKTVNDNGQEVDDYSFSITTEGLISDTPIIPDVLSKFLEAFNKITIGIDENLGTTINASSWVCKNDGGEDVCTPDNPHKVWQCTCSKIADCCTCCTGGCTSVHPCDKNGECRNVDCACGYINDPDCGYQISTEDQINNIDSTVNTVAKTIGQLLDSSVGTSAKEQMAVGATAAKINETETATNKLDERFAVKATTLDVFDIQEAGYDSSTNSIMFTLDQQNNDNNYVALSHLTNDYVTNEQFVEALKLSAAEKLGSSVEALNGMLVNTYLKYDNIICTVKFVGATDDNIYGTGEIEKISLSYDCEATSEAMISYRLATHMDSTAKNIKYADYEKGDVNMNASVETKDAKLTLRYLVDLETLNDYQMYLADMNDDGNVSIVDAKAILEKIASQPV